MTKTITGYVVRAKDDEGDDEGNFYSLNGSQNLSFTLNLKDAYRWPNQRLAENHAKQLNERFIDSPWKVVPVVRKKGAKATRLVGLNLYEQGVFTPHIQQLAQLFDLNDSKYTADDVAKRAVQEIQILDKIRALTHPKTTRFVPPNDDPRA